MIGMTKNDINYRRQQLLKFKQFLTEQKDVLSVAVKQDLHKHPFETFAGEIAPVLGEIEYMLTVRHRKLFCYCGYSLTHIHI